MPTFPFPGQLPWVFGEFGGGGGGGLPPSLNLVNPITANPANASPYGQDIDFMNGLNPLLPLLGGLANLGQALAHRLSTPRGGLFYDPGYGTDIRAYLNEAMTAAKAAQLQADIANECLKDERVQSVSATAVFEPSEEELEVTINVIAAPGPFVLQLSVSDVTVAVLAINPVS